MLQRAFFCSLLLLISHVTVATEHWFDTFKRNASPDEMYRFLYALPKAGDLHNHLSGAGISEWWFELAIDESKNGGYRYYTKVSINNCGYGANQFGFSPYLLLFVNKQESSYLKLNECQRSEYKLLTELTPNEKSAWLESIRLDKPHEGRNEFFETHWQRLNDLSSNPYIIAEIMVKNMQAFGDEGLSYIEFQHGVFNYINPKGDKIAPNEVANIIRSRLAQDDATRTGVVVKMQASILRFMKNAESTMEAAYHFVNDNRDLYVGVNMVGREDNDKGHPKRFLPVLRKLRRKFAMNLAFHAGEVDEPNSHVKDTLLLGAKRIGHGLNLISDPDTLLLMRNSDYLVEVNLVSNYLLEYVDTYAQHPFPEYLRIGIPVALSTDDRGMWDSTMTDEYYIAVSEFNLSWSEIVSIGRNSILHSFADQQLKNILLTNFNAKIASFEKDASNDVGAILRNSQVSTFQFACKKFKICDYVVYK